MPEQTKKILLAEDDEFLSSLIKNRLERENYSVTLVVDGSQIIEAMKREKPQLMLLDLILPNKLGFEVLEEAKADPEIDKIPVMVISNLGQPEDIKKTQELGAIDYFIKAQILIDDLIKRIAVFFEKGKEGYQPE
ncbi:MAG: response regulator [Candidatus Paceibacterota bacterium]